MNIKRGVIAALSCSSLGAAVTALPLAAFVFRNWLINDTIPVEREFDLRWLSTALIGPAIGVAIYLGLTGFVTFAPTGNYGFARTLATIFFVSIPLTIILGNLELTPKRVKSINHPLVYPSELAIFLMPPAGIAALLLASRLSSESNDNITTRTEQSDAHQALDRPF